MRFTVSQTRTYRFLGTCETCIRPLAVEETSTSGTYTFAPCPECTKTVKLTRLVAVTSADYCDGSCMGAAGPNCSCSCGGENHGVMWSGGARKTTTMQFEDALKAHRAKVIKKREAVTKRREAAATKVRNAFQEWAEPHEVLINYLLAYEGDSVFLSSLGSQVRDLKQLSDRQLEAGYQAMDREIQWAAERAVRDAQRAEEAANAKPVPTGKGVIITGRVASVKDDTTYYGGRPRTTSKMMVIGDGWRVWVTVPQELADVNLTTRNNSYGLRDVQVELTANITAADDDPSMGFGKLPRKARRVNLVNA